MARTLLYKTAETEMIRRIRAGDWAQGQRLPNEFALADEFGVSQGTMRRALISLEAMGLLDRKPGRGTSVAERTHAASDRGTPGAQNAFQPTTPAGLPLSLEVFRRRSATRGATPSENALFGHSRIATLERTLKQAGTRIALEVTAIPEPHAANIPEDAPLELPDLLAALDLRPASYTDTVTASITSMSQSVALSTDRHTALLVLTRTAYDADDTAVACQIQHMIGHAITFQTTHSA